MKLIVKCTLVLIAFAVLFSDVSSGNVSTNAENLMKLSIKLINSNSANVFTKEAKKLTIQLSCISDIDKYKILTKEDLLEDESELILTYTENRGVVNESALLARTISDNSTQFVKKQKTATANINDEIRMIRQLLNFNAHPSICFNFNEDAILYGDNYFASIHNDGTFYHCNCYIDSSGFKLSHPSVTAHSFIKQIINRDINIESATTDAGKLFRFGNGSDFEFNAEFDNRGHCIYISFWKKA